MQSTERGTGVAGRELVPGEALKAEVVLDYGVLGVVSRKRRYPIQKGLSLARTA